MELNLVKIPKRKTNFGIPAKTPFISVYPGGQGNIINLSTALVKGLDIVVRNGIGFKPDKTNPQLLFMYVTQTFRSDSDEEAEVYKYNRNPHRIHSKPFVDKIAEIYGMKNGYGTYRLYVNIKKPVVLEVNEEPVNFYLVYDIPHLRVDLTKEEQEVYAEELYATYKKLV